MLVLAAVENRYERVARGKRNLSYFPFIRTVPDRFEVWVDVEVAYLRKGVLQVT